MPRRFSPFLPALRNNFSPVGQTVLKTSLGGIRMNQPDTVNLLQECDAGIRMGLDSIRDMMDSATQPLRQQLQEYRMEHEELQQRTEQLLGQHRKPGKEPAVMAKGMSWMKTNMKLAMETSDSTIAELVTDGCNMGIKSLNKYLNQFPQADASSREVACRLIDLEQRMVKEMQPLL